MAYTRSTDGSDWGEPRIRRLADGQDLPERLEGLLWAKAASTRDSTGFFYQRTQRAGSGERTMLRAPAVYVHRVDSPQAADLVVFRTAEETSDLVVDIGMSDDGRNLFVYEGNGADVTGIGWLLTRVHVLDLGRTGPAVVTNPVVPFTPDRVAAYRVIASDAEQWFVLTDRGAPRRRLVTIDPRHPSPNHWREIIPESGDVLDRVYALGSRFAAVYRRDLQHAVRIFDRRGRLIRELAIDPMRKVLDVQAGRNNDEVVVDTMSFLVPPARSRYSLRSGATTLDTPPTGPVSAVDIEVKQVWLCPIGGSRLKSLRRPSTIHAVENPDLT
ncbi:MAG: hypothetical protein ABIX28_13175 [Vicinamibacterales bacterium]